MARRSLPCVSRREYANGAGTKPLADAGQPIALGLVPNISEACAFRAQTIEPLPDRGGEPTVVVLDLGHRLALWDGRRVRCDVPGGAKRGTSGPARAETPDLAKSRLARTSAPRVLVMNSWSSVIW